MTATDRQGYEAVLAEIRTMALRLKEISDGGYADMEGADATEFRISEILWCELRDAARTLAAAHREVKGLLPETSTADPFKLVCPTCRSAKWAEIHESKTDPTGFTLYCRRCEEGCVSPLRV